MAMAAKRLQKEAVALAREPPHQVRAKPLESDILIFHYVIEGPCDSPFEGGYYHGVLKFPPEYPLKPPAVLMYTPNGRFQTHTRICMSMSDYHPETWNPVWSVGTILVGLQSFMLEQGDSVGTVKTSEEQRRKYATESLETNLANKDFCRLFPELVELAETKRRERDLARSTNGRSSQSSVAGAQTAEGNAAGNGGSSMLYQLAVLIVLIAVVIGWVRSQGDTRKWGMP